jgi:CheY-like chemotaxis protein
LRIILLDLMMPGLDGTATLAALRGIVPRVPVIICSGLMPPSSGGTVGLGEAARLMKPYTSGQLLQTLHRVLTRSTI